MARGVDAIKGADEVKERPILFSGPMVRAILEGRKTQTRRVVKPQPFDDPSSVRPWVDDGPTPSGAGRCGHTLRLDECPYGVPGDRLVVKESYRLERKWDSYAPSEVLNDTPPAVWYEADERVEPIESSPWGKLRPSIHMPWKIARITLEVVGARVERVHEISAKDIIAEGAVERAHHVEAFEMVGSNPKCPISAFDGMCYPDLRSLWAAGWNSINGKGSWESNPFCWVIEFRRIK